MKLQNILNQQTILWYLIKMVKCFQVKTFRFLKKKMLERTKRICFLIGSELGLDLSLKNLLSHNFLGKENLATSNGKNNVN